MKAHVITLLLGTSQAFKLFVDAGTEAEQHEMMDAFA